MKLLESFSLTSLVRSISFALLLVPQISSSGQQVTTRTISKEQELGIALYKKGETKEAIKQLAADTKKNSDNAESWYFLGLAQLRDGDYKNSRKALEKATKLKPDLAKHHAAWSYVLLLSGKDRDAEREAQKAIELNRDQSDAHYVLGVIRLRQNRNVDARTEAETAIKSQPDLAVGYLLQSQALVGIYSDAAWESNQSAGLPYTSLTEAERSERDKKFKKGLEPLVLAASALEKFLTLSVTNAETSVWRDQLKTLKAYASFNENTEPKTYRGVEVTTKARVLAKPEPTYTEAARNAGITGTVLLSAVFTADGKVEDILVLHGLPLGLTAQSIAVAKRIKFVPAIKEGKPVSMYMHLEYNFYLY